MIFQHIFWTHQQQFAINKYTFTIEVYSSDVVWFCFKGEEDNLEKEQKRIFTPIKPFNLLLLLILAFK